MTNIYLLIIETIICLITMIISYKKYKLDGLYGYIIIAFILSNIMSLKIIPLYGFDINLGIVPLTTTFIASNIIIQKYGTEEIKKLSITLVITSIISFLIVYLTSLLNSSSITLFTDKSYDNIFSGNEKNIFANIVIRIYFANIVTILYTMLLNSKLYYYLKTVKNKIWISNLFSTIITQFIVALLFNIFAYALIKEWINIIQFIIIRYFISLLVMIIGTINIYIARAIKEK